MKKAFICLFLLIFLSFPCWAGISKIYKVPYNQVFDAIIDVLEGADYVIATEDIEKGRILTDYKIKSQFLGDSRLKFNVRIKSNEKGIEVRANCSGGSKLTVAVDSGGSGRDWTEFSEKRKAKSIKEFFKRLDKKLEK